MVKGFPLPRVEGVASRQAHADLPPGTFERELGRDGFYGPATHMYHRHPPTGWSGWEGPLRPRAFDLTDLPRRDAPCPWAVPDLLHNAALRLRFWSLDRPMPDLARNGDGDDLVFVHRGRAAFLCDYGHLEIEAGDYLVIPRGTMWRLEAHEPLDLLMVEATGDAYRLPDRGATGAHAPYDPALLDTPRLDEPFRQQQEARGDAPGGGWRVRIRRRGQVSTVTYPFNPLDALGWKGDLVPVRLNVRDIRPLMSHRVHLPPSAHSTFLADRFVVCSFVPRPFESDPGALKVPFFHSNDDFDEVLFYHAGDFFSRDHIKPGMMTLHPSGFTHGPHPKALQGALVPKKPATDEVAVMVDARDALEVGPAASAVEWAGYADSWAPQSGRAAS